MRTTVSHAVVWYVFGVCIYHHWEWRTFSDANGFASSSFRNVLCCFWCVKGWANRFDSIALKRINCLAVQLLIDGQIESASRIKLISMQHHFIQLQYSRVLQIEKSSLRSPKNLKLKKPLSVHGSRCDGIQNFNPRGQFVSFSISWHIDDGEAISCALCVCVCACHGLAQRRRHSPF